MKKVLLSFFVIGVLSCFTFASVYAVLNSETQDNRMTIASGTLTFGDTVNTGSTCYTYGTGSSANVNNTCDALFTSATLMYPGTEADAKVTITNNGSIDGSALSVYMPSCTMVTSPGATAPGGLSPCGSGGAQIYIQETDSSWTPLSSCLYPTSATQPCIGTGGVGWIANTMSYLSSSRNSVGSAWPLGSGPAAGSSRYFIIGMELPTNASNALQGEEASFNLTWHLST